MLAAEAGAALFMTVCDVPRQSRSELCLHAGVHALIAIADFQGIPHHPPKPDADIRLSQASFNKACGDLQQLGVPVRQGRHATWLAFRTLRARYEPLLAVIGPMTDAPRSEWSSWTDTAPRHNPPLFRLKQL